MWRIWIWFLRTCLSDCFVAQFLTLQLRVRVLIHYVKNQNLNKSDPDLGIGHLKALYSTVNLKWKLKENIWRALNQQKRVFLHRCLCLSEFWAMTIFWINTEGRNQTRIPVINSDPYGSGSLTHVSVFASQEATWILIPFEPNANPRLGFIL